jgi:putative ubiquitin-RnfH superfamily antitoxin RatB of RatAB toxin-antitoxin module
MGRQQSHWHDGLNERERIVVQMLAAGNTIRAAAIKAGVSEKTVYNYRQRRHVQDAIYASQIETFEGKGNGAELLPEVVGVLREIVNDPEARAADRIQASRTLIQSANDYAARRGLERQIRDLETRLFGAPVTPEPGEAHLQGTSFTADDLQEPPEAADAIIDVVTK